MTLEPKTSIIIRTLNEAKYLLSLLKAIREQKYKNFEIILVDSGSFDGTVEIAEPYCDQILRISQEEFTFGFAINYGVKHANGELVCILSAHTLPLNCNWLSELVDSLGRNGESSSVAMAYGKQVGVGASNFSEVMDFRRQFQDKKLFKTRPNYFCNNANSMIRRDLWEKHPFDEALTGLEDIEWAKYWMDQGYQIVYCPGAAIYHIHIESPQQIRRRFWREAMAARSIGVLSIPKILLQFPKELGYIFADVAVSAKQKKIKKINEIFKYRVNKSIGILKSLSNKKHKLIDYSSNYVSYGYTVVEFNKPYYSVLKTYPLQPTRPNEVLIKVAYVGICETDFEVLGGVLDYYKTGWAKYPIVPGHEYSGTIARVGAKVQGFAVGEKVVGQCILSCGKCEFCLSGREIACKDRKEVGVLNYHGAYAEYITLDARFVHKIPNAMSLVTASSIEPLAVVIKGLDRLGIKSADSALREQILIIGGGPIGHLAARLCHHWGHEVILVDKNNSRLNLLGDIDIQTYLELPKLSSHAKIIEATGDPELGQIVIENSAIGSTVLLLGLPYSETSFNIEKIVTQDRKIVGSVGSSGEDFRIALEIAGKINLDCFDKCIFDLSSWKNAWREHKNKKVLKVKLEIDKEIKGW